MNNLIGLATRARKTILGTDMTINGVRKQTVKLVILATDASDNTKKLVFDKCKTYHVEVVSQLPSAQLSQAVGKSNIMVVGIADEGFSKLILNQKRK